MKNIAIIPARGGSKRIPQKNIKEFMGKPIIAYAIEAAINSGVFNEVMVSTDCEHIARVAQQYGADVPFMRSTKTSDDFATTFDVIDEVIAGYKMLGLGFDNLCCVYPCVPFLKAETLKRAYTQMNDNDAVMPVCKFPVPIEWAMAIENGVLVPNDRAAQNLRSQDISAKYFDCGMFYFCKTEKIYENHSLVPNKTAAFVMDETEMQDIDTIHDWKFAEMKYKVLQTS